ncbi:MULTISPECIES: SGNH/GDSL hydrolase family protein [Sphingomonas]|uniref:SGNH/GDSL hydrolase family protein n=1 Tax=Sphingomonas TaxID=13687 RepID=UPI0020C0450B|nr:SGNH/GDSL hydrolase family protein [Sphingomonas faeni]MCK8455626.1 SGNH/GDSL hydrolase family protein [Sphingomonas faeni]
MTRVLVFGFSVTEETAGFVPLVKRALAGEIAVDRKAVGGAAIAVVPYLGRLLRYDRYDYVLFEIATCLRYAEADPGRYDTALAEIVAQVRQGGAVPCFVNLFRGPVDYRTDRLVRSIRAIADKEDLPLLDLTDRMVQAKAEGRLADFLRDGTHTTPLGAACYADEIGAFLRQVVRDRPWVNTTNTVCEARFRYIPATSFGAVAGVLERKGVKLSYVELAAGAMLRGTLSEELTFRGLLFAMGPSTGILEVASGGMAHKATAYDEFSYYRRFSYWLRTLPESRNFIVRQLDLEPKAVLRKGDRHSGPRVGQIAGILAEAVGEQGPVCLSE